MTPWLSIVGLGEDGIEALNPVARALVAGAEVLIGGERHLAMLADDGRERLAWPTPLAEMFPEIAHRRGRRVCVLASGDPLCYGVGAALIKHFAIEEMTIVPAPSAFSLACARLGWSLPDLAALTLHGRPPALLHPHVQPDARLLILSAGRDTPAQVAALLRARGYGESRLVVLEHMGGPRERRIEASAEAWAAEDLADLNTLAVVCVAGPEAALLPATPGLPDEAFRNDGQLTKREVRAVTLAALAPVPGQLLWDLGAGCGSVAIEWMRAAPRARAVAVERKAERVNLIAANATALGTPLLEIVEGAAPAALEGLEPPDAIFIGGGATAEGLFEACWDRLKSGGRLVANAVTVEGEVVLLRRHAAQGGTLTRLAVSRGEPVGSFTGWRPLMPVTQYAAVKP